MNYVSFSVAGRETCSFVTANGVLRNQVARAELPAYGAQASR